MIEIYNEKV